MDKFDFTSHDVEADRQEWLGVWKQTVERHSGGAEIPSFLSFFNEEEIRIVHDLGRRLHLVPGHSLYYEGQVANSFGLVLDGLLEASVQDDNGEPQIVGRIRAADTFGEMPLIVDGSIGGGKREATLTSVEKSTLVVISYTKFAQMFESLSPARKKALRTELTKMVCMLPIMIAQPPRSLPRLDRGELPQHQSVRPSEPLPHPASGGQAGVPDAWETGIIAIWPTAEKEGLQQG
jgi:hypothetical protein